MPHEPKVWLHRRETARDYNGYYALAGGGVDAREKAAKQPRASWPKKQGW